MTITATCMENLPTNMQCTPEGAFLWKKVVRAKWGSYTMGLFSRIVAVKISTGH